MGVGSLRTGSAPKAAITAAMVSMVALLAGCTEDAPTGSIEGASGLDIADPEAIPLTGRLVDDEIVPRPGVEVTLRPDGLVSTTDDAGQFQFGLKAPGTYTLWVLEVGFDEILHEINVPAAGLHDVVLTMIPSPEGIPYHETEIYVSYTLCTAGTGGGCGLPLNTYTSQETASWDYSDFEWEIPYNGLVDVLVESDWEPTTTGGSVRVFTRNMDGLFLGCNSTGPAGTGEAYTDSPTRMYFTNTTESPPHHFWVEVGSWNTEVGGCWIFEGQKGDRHWFGVRPNGAFPFIFDVDRRVEIYLTYFYWRAGDRGFTFLEGE